MRIKEGFLLRNVSEAYVVVATGEAAKSFNGMITLNTTGAFLWQQLAKGCKDEAELVDKLLAEYDVDRTQAEADVNAFTARIKDAGLLEA